MSKIYEALQKVQQERKDLTEAPLPTQQVGCPVEIPDLKMDLEMLMLYQSIDSQLPDLHKKTIQFIGSRVGEGTSTIVREFANMSALRLGKAVLVVNADHDNPGSGLHYGITADPGSGEALVQIDQLGHRVHLTRHENVFVSPVSRNYGSFIQKFESPSATNFCEQMKQEYDLILIDSPPASQNPLGFAFCRRVDGVVIVLEAEKTRWPVVESVKNRIIGCGGRVLGVVLNKRRYSIPESVYSRL